MKLAEYEEKNIEITTTNGSVYKGKATDYTPADENTPEIDSICIGELEFYANDIESIKIIG